MGWVVNATPRPLYPWERHPVPTVQEAGWAPGAVWTGAESLVLTGIRSPDLPDRNLVAVRGNVQGEFLPGTGNKGPKREHMYTSTLSLTSELDEGGW